MVRWAALYVFGFQIYSYVGCHYRTIKRFDLLSWQLCAAAAALLLLAAPLAMNWGARGAILAQASACYLPALMAFRIRSDTPALQPLFDWREWLTLLRVGLPIMLVGLGYFFLTTMDRFVVLYLGGLEKLGNYAFQMRVLSVAPLLASLVADQFYPRVAETYGRTRAPAALNSLLRWQLGATMAMTIVVNGCLFVALPFIVSRFLPAYRSSLALSPILLLGMTFLPLCTVFGVFLNVLNWQMPYLAVQTCVIAAGIAGSVSLTRVFGLYGAAWATTLAYFGYFALLALLLARAMRPRTEAG